MVARARETKAQTYGACSMALGTGLEKRVPPVRTADVH